MASASVAQAQPQQLTIAQIGDQLGVLETQHFEFLKRKVILEQRVLTEKLRMDSKMIIHRRHEIESFIEQIPLKRKAFVEQQCRDSILMQNWFLTASLYTWRQHCIGYLLRYLLEQQQKTLLPKLKRARTEIDKKPLVLQSNDERARTFFLEIEIFVLENDPSEFESQLKQEILLVYKSSWKTSNRHVLDTKFVYFSDAVKQYWNGVFESVPNKTIYLEGANDSLLQVHPFCQSMVTRMNVTPSDLLANQLYKYPQEELLFNIFKFRSYRNFYIYGSWRPNTFRYLKRININDATPQYYNEIDVEFSGNNIYLKIESKFVPHYDQMLSNDRALEFFSQLFPSCVRSRGDYITVWSLPQMIQSWDQALLLDYNSNIHIQDKVLIKEKTKPEAKELMLDDSVILTTNNRYDAQEKEEKEAEFNINLWQGGIQTTRSTLYFIWTRTSTTQIPEVWYPNANYTINQRVLFTGNIYRSIRANSNILPSSTNPNNPWEIVPKTPFTPHNQELFLFQVKVNENSINLKLYQPTFYKRAIYDCMNMNIFPYNENIGKKFINPSFAGYYAASIVAASTTNNQTFSNRSGHVEFISGTDVCAAIVLARELKTSVGSVMVNLAKLWADYFDLDVLDLNDASSVPCGRGDISIGLRILGLIKNQRTWYGRFGFVLKDVSTPALELFQLLLNTPWSVIQNYVTMTEIEKNAVDLFVAKNCPVTSNCKLTFGELLQTSTKYCGIYDMLVHKLSNNDWYNYISDIKFDLNVPLQYKQQVKLLADNIGDNFTEKWDNIFQTYGIWYRRSSILRRWLLPNENQTLQLEKAKEDVVEALPLQLTKDLF